MAAPEMQREQPIVITESMLHRRPRTSAHDARVAFEEGMSYFPPLTMIMIAVLIGFFVWEVRTGVLASPARLTAAGALVRARVFQGEAWRLIKAGMLHGGLDHLIGNVVALYIVGMGCEHAFGSVKTYAIFFASLIAASALSVMQHAGPSVGASGAIFGLVGALIMVIVRWRSLFHVRDARIGVVLAVWAGYVLYQGTLDPLIDNAAHMGGVITGAVLGLAFQPSVVGLRRKNRRS